jgi:hypothetical protein
VQHTKTLTTPAPAAQAETVAPAAETVNELPAIEEINAPVLAFLQRRPFDTLLVAIEEDKTSIYFGDTGRYALPGTLAHNRHPAIDLNGQKFDIPQTTVSNRVDTGYKIQLTKNGDASLVKQIHFSGTAYEAFHQQFAEFTPEDLRREQQAQLSRLSQSAEAAGPMIPSFEKGRLEFAASLKNYAVRDGDHLYFTLPEVLGNILQIQSDRRDTPFCIETPIHTSYSYEIDLPTDWQPVLLPEEFEAELPNGAGTVRVRTSVLRNKLMILQEASVEPAIIPVEEYGQLLELTDRLTRPAAHTILLKKSR